MQRFEPTADWSAARPCRWLMMASHVPPSGTGGGMVRYAVEVAKALARRDDVELHMVVQPEAADAFPDLIGIESRAIHAVPGNVTTASLRQRFGHSMGDVDAFDVVHGTKHLLPRKARGVRMLTVHDLLPFDRANDFGRAKKVLLPRQYRSSILDADALVCVSNATRSRLIAQVPGTEQRAYVVPLALADSLLDAVAVPSPMLVGRRFALVVGDSSRRKNLRFISQLWPAVRQRIPDLCLAVAGPAGWGVNDGLPQLQQLVNGGSAVPLGHISDSELAWAYRHAAVVLCPSRLEGFGLPALEAVTFGAPVVRSPDPAMAEASGGHGDVVSLVDPLGWVEAIERNARTRAEEEGETLRGTADVVVARRFDDVARETLAAAAHSAQRKIGAAVNDDRDHD